MFAKVRAVIRAIQKFRKGLSKADRQADKLRDRMLLKDIERSAKLVLICLVLAGTGCGTTSVRFLESDGISVPWYRRAVYNVLDGVSRTEALVGDERIDD